MRTTVVRPIDWLTVLLSASRLYNHFAAPCAESWIAS